MSINNYEETVSTFSIYPNPVSSIINIRVNNKISFTENDSITLFNILGKSVYKQNIESQNTSIDLSTYSKGIYLLHSEINGISQTFKVVKE